MGPSSSSKENTNRHPKKKKERNTSFKSLKCEESRRNSQGFNNVYISPPPRPSALSNVTLKPKRHKQHHFVRRKAPLAFQSTLKVPRNENKTHRRRSEPGEEWPCPKTSRAAVSRRDGLYLRSTECRYCCSCCPSTGSSTGPSS